MLLLVFLLSTCVLIEAWRPPINTQLKSLRGYKPDPHLNLSDNIKRFMSELKWNFRRQNTKHWLQLTVPEPPRPNPAEAKVAESELRQSISNRNSALDYKPYVEKNGLNDFLVITGPKDPTSNIIPNDIYYNIEKGCVNWLDNCNQKGMKATLINRIYGPYRK